MTKRMLAVVAGLAVILAVSGCKKKEEKPIPPPSAPQSGIMMPPGETKVIAPDFLKGKWSAVKMTIEEKASGKKDEVTIQIGGDHTIPGSNLKVVVNEFFPDFVMEGFTITSRSDSLNNPAVNVTIFEGDSEVFKGWLYSKFPAIHPFQHDKYGVTLKDAVKKG